MYHRNYSYKCKLLLSPSNIHTQNHEHLYTNFDLFAFTEVKHKHPMQLSTVTAHTDVVLITAVTLVWSDNRSIMTNVLFDQVVQTKSRKVTILTWFFIAHPTVAEDKVQHIVVDRRDNYWSIVEDEIF